MTNATVRSRIAYCQRRLAQPDLHPDIRAQVTLALARYAALAGGHCERCGRRLWDPASVTAGVGPVCIHRAASQ